MRKYLLLVLLLLITIYSRFINLNWDQGFGFHPDENNLWGASRRVAAAVRRDGFSLESLDPEFYAYGGFPIYLYSLVPDKIYARAVSAGIQLLIVLLLFIVGKQLSSTKGGSGGWTGGLITAAIGAFSAGLVQAAHFLTVESLLGLFGLIIVFSLLHSIRMKGLGLILASLALGLGVATKVSFALFSLPFLAIFIPPAKAGLKLKIRKLMVSILVLVSSFLVALSVFIACNPFIFDRWESVRGTLRYETRVAIGDQAVFYTRQFTETIPGWFQTTRVFPFITGCLFVPLLVVGIVVLGGKLFIKRRRPPLSYEQKIRGNQKDWVLFLGMLAAVFSFLPLWAKWTRYVIQVLPVLILVAGIGAGWLWEKGRIERLLVGLSLISFVFPFFTLLTVYVTPDSRIQAADWAETNISREAKIFTEAMDLGIIPFNAAHMTQITLFNFYELDEDTTGKKQEKLDSLIRESDYFISVSRRIYGNSLNHPDRFPRSAQFYQSLLNGSLGYTKVAEYSDGPDFSFKEKSLARQNPVVATPRRMDVDHGSGEHTTGVIPFFRVSSPEETFRVFDHPTVMIFEHKIKHQNNSRPADQLLFRP